MIEYSCSDCGVSEFDFEVIPNKQCTECGFLMEAKEVED